MKTKSLFLFLALLSILGGWSGCTTDFEVYATEKEVVVVYCLLDPAQDEQYVRLGKGFQVEGDAIEYAGENDLSMPGMTVQLSVAETVVNTAEETDSIPKQEGVFNSQQTVYKFITDGSPGHPRIENNVLYKLVISMDEELYATARTLVPGGMRLSSKNIPGAGTTKCLFNVDITKDINVLAVMGSATGFELRVVLDYERNGEVRQAIWGPSRLFDDSNCNSSSSEVCYQISAYELYGFFGNRLSEEGLASLTYDDSPACAPDDELELLPKSFTFELSGVDEEMRKYIVANSPEYADLTGAKPEYSNVGGKNGRLGKGIFGAVSRDSKYLILDECAQYLLGLNNAEQPVGCLLP